MKKKTAPKQKLTMLTHKGTHVAHHVCKDVSIVVAADGIRHSGILESLFGAAEHMRYLVPCASMMAGAFFYFGVPMLLELWEERA